jgi:hypothetical protein
VVHTLVEVKKLAEFHERFVDDRLAQKGVGAVSEQFDEVELVRESVDDVPDEGDVDQRRGGGKERRAAVFG